MKILKKHESGWYILCFKIWFPPYGCFNFRWFTDCGDWFVYIAMYGRNKGRTIRLSSAGCYNETW